MISQDVESAGFSTTRKSVGCLHLPYSGLIRYLKERDLQAIRVLETHIVIAPGCDNRGAISGFALHYRAI